MPSLEALAEHPGIVFGAYIAALLPLAVIYALDFISEKWRPIRETRRKGYFYLFSSIIPLGFVMFYIHLQKVAKDYKEMAAAVSAAIFCIVHIMRTIWGLVQLRVFKAWNVRALYCLHVAGYKDLSHNESGSASYSADSDSHNSLSTPTLKQMFTRARDWAFSKSLEAIQSSATERKGPESDSSSISHSSGAGTSYSEGPYRFLRLVQNWISPAYNKLNRTKSCVGHFFLHSESELEAVVDNTMVVNSGLPDNEFMGADLPCRLNIQTMLSALWSWLTTRSTFSLLGHLESVHPVECSVQWMVSFLSKFGGKWLANHHLSTSRPENIFERELKLGLRALLFTTYDDSECELQSVLHPASEFTQREDLLLSELYVVPGRSCLPFNMRGLNQRYVTFDSFESSVRNGIVSWDNKSLHDLEPEEREAVRNISPYDLSRFAVLMDVVLENKDRSYPFRSKYFSHVTKESSCVKAFLWQIDCTSQQSIEHLLKFVSVSSEVSSEAPWKGVYKNELVLQASVHVDNWKSLKCGSDIDEAEVQHQRLTFECAKRKELLRQRIILASGGSIQGKTVFLGCVIESVRTFLAVWSRGIADNGASAVITQEDLWRPEIGKTSAEFKCSDQLRESLYVFRVDEVSDTDVPPFPFLFADSVQPLQSAKMRLLWELQTRLHEMIASEVYLKDFKENLPQSELLIILFLLGFPALDINLMPDVTSLETDLCVATTQRETEITFDPLGSVERDTENSTHMGSK